MINNTPSTPITERLLCACAGGKTIFLKGTLPPGSVAPQKGLLSCIIPSCRKEDHLSRLLTDLVQQTLKKDAFEVLVLDNTPDGNEHTIRSFTDRLNIRYLRETTTSGMIGELRNRLLKDARGEWILFLDDDTRLPQPDMLSQAVDLLKTNPIDILLPCGEGLALDGRPDYTFLDPFSLAARCCFYQRRLLDQLAGFHDDIPAYEDIDLGIRAILAKARIMRMPTLTYQHPALYFNSMQKPIAIGQSILQLRQHYPLLLWLLLYGNALRFLILGLFPTTKNRQWFKISLGVLLAPLIQKKQSYRP